MDGGRTGGVKWKLQGVEITPPGVGWVLEGGLGTGREEVEGPKRWEGSDRGT